MRLVQVLRRMCLLLRLRFPIKRQNAIVGCRSCEGTKEEIPNLDKEFTPRLHSEILKTRELLRTAANKTAQANLEKETVVLATPSPFEKISLDICNPPTSFDFLFFSFFLFVLLPQSTSLFLVPCELTYF